jgi:hypothetical protein
MRIEIEQLFSKLKAASAIPDRLAKSRFEKFYKKVHNGLINYLINHCHRNNFDR